MSTTIKNEMREVMQTAWQFVRRNGYTMAEALKCAWANLKLRKAMARRICRFYFIKVDGSIREAALLQATSYLRHQVTLVSVMIAYRPTTTQRKQLGVVSRKPT